MRLARARGSGRNRRGHQDEGGATAFRTGPVSIAGNKCGRLRPAETPAGKAGIVALQQKHSWRICRLSAYACESQPGTLVNGPPVRALADPAPGAAAPRWQRSWRARQLHDSRFFPALQPDVENWLGFGLRRADKTHRALNNAPPTPKVRTTAKTTSPPRRQTIRHHISRITINRISVISSIA